MKALCVLFLAIPLAMAGEHETLCREHSIGLHDIEPNDLFAFKDIEFTSFTDLSTASFRFVNRSGKSIDYMRILLEFRDVNNQYLMTMPIEIVIRLRYEGSGVPDPIDSTTNTRNVLQGPLLPLQKKRLYGSTRSSTSHCPIVAVISAATVRFTDGSKFEWLSPTWRWEPHLRRVTPVDLTSLQVPLPVDWEAEVVIDAQGKGKVKDVKGATSDQTSWLQTQIDRWAFWPAMLGGKPIEQNYVLLLRIRKDQLRPTLESLRNVPEKVFSVVEIFSHSVDNRQIIFNGTLPVDGADIF